jgi:hypothetical protein
VPELCCRIFPEQYWLPTRLVMCIRLYLQPHIETLRVMHSKLFRMSSNCRHDDDDDHNLMRRVQCRVCIAGRWQLQKDTNTKHHSLMSNRLPDMHLQHNDIVTSMHVLFIKSSYIKCRWAKLCSGTMPFILLYLRLHGLIDN